MYCGGGTQVINSRPQKRTNTVWRRRRCVACNSLITTEEAPRYETALMIEMPSGSLEPFMRDILLISVYKSLAHRKSAAADATALTKTLLGSLQRDAGKAAILTKPELISLVAACLDRFDSAAGSHYRAYHPL